ncbi:hypothetical protein VR41_02510 [Streptomyces sp. NRRL B-1568]|nr:hypothetical protein VR41_02510 [Streptomyces sp. NRRL B-1568]
MAAVTSLDRMTKRIRIPKILAIAAAGAALMTAAAPATASVRAAADPAQPCGLSFTNGVKYWNNCSDKSVTVHFQYMEGIQGQQCVAPGVIWKAPSDVGIVWSATDGC